MKIFVIDKERRSSKKTRPQLVDRRMRKGASKRYLLIVNDPEIEEIIKREFSKPPNAIYPHESGENYIFYCVAGPSYRKGKRFVKSLFRGLKKNKMKLSELNQLQVHLCHNESDSLKAVCYQMRNNALKETKF